MNSHCKLHKLLHIVLPCGYIGLKLNKEILDEDGSYEKANVNEVIDIKTSRKNCINKANTIITKYKEFCGIPGLSVSVSIDGKIVWSKGYGYSDVENLIPCTPDSVFRIASISKAFTSILYGQLIEKNLINPDEDIQSYLKNFPTKYIDGKPVTITTQQLITHTAGIRHYTKVEEKKSDSKDSPSDTHTKEFYIKDHYNSVHDALSIFQNDALYHAPGTGFLYTSHGFNLLSAVIENCANKDETETSKRRLSFTTLMSNLFSKMGMDNSYADENNPLIMNRVRYYRRVGRGQLENTPYVDNSYKWAGGGFLSTVEDLCRFGSTLGSIYTGQPVDNPVINKETLQKLWTPHVSTSEYSRGKLWYKDGVYAMGWCIVEPRFSASPPDDRILVSHTGGAVGATSVLLISIPVKEHLPVKDPPGVIVVAILTNLQDATGVGKTGRQLAKLFAENYPVS